MYTQQFYSYMCIRVYIYIYTCLQYKLLHAALRIVPECSEQSWLLQLKLANNPYNNNPEIINYSIITQWNIIQQRKLK